MATWSLGPLGLLFICAVDGGGASNFVGLEEDDDMGSTYRETVWTGKHISDWNTIFLCISNSVVDLQQQETS